MTNNGYWRPVLTDPMSRTPWRIGRPAAGGMEYVPAYYATWADAAEDAGALNAVAA